MSSCIPLCAFDVRMFSVMLTPVTVFPVRSMPFLFELIVLFCMVTWLLPVM